MKCTALLVSTLALLSIASEVQARSNSRWVDRGNVFELTRTRDMAQHDNRGGRGSSHDQDKLVERVIEAGAEGVVLEYDLPPDPGGRRPSSNWEFPARFLKSADGAIQLLNQHELEARIDPWLTNNGLTRAACGRLLFTWNAFRIGCDPQAVVAVVAAFDLTSFDPREGEVYRDPQAAEGTQLTPDSTGRALTGEMAINPDLVRRSRAETDVGVAEILRKPLSLEEALAVRAKDDVSGSVQVKFELTGDRRVTRKTTVRKVQIRRPDGTTEEQTVTETLERRQLARH